MWCEEQAKECGWPLETGKGKDHVFPYNLQEKHDFADNYTLGVWPAELL